jgi:hypothetical protein
MKFRKREYKMGQDEIMALSFGALNLADYLTTRRILSTGGEELNPIADFLIMKKCFGIFKLASTLAGMASVYVEDKPKTVSMTLLGFYGFVVAHNLKEVVQHEKEIKKMHQNNVTFKTLMLRKNHDD